LVRRIDMLGFHLSLDIEIVVWQVFIDKDGTRWAGLFFAHEEILDIECCDLGVPSPKASPDGGHGTRAGGGGVKESRRMGGGCCHGLRVRRDLTDIWLICSLTPLPYG
jgi:hypothetical protein